MSGKLSRLLHEWKNEGLISGQQIDDIIAYESGRKKTQWLILSLMSLGGITLSIGVISIVASNWSSIPISMKLGVDFLVLSTLAYFIYKCDIKERFVATDVLITIFSFLYFASIGLVSQIYHTGGELYQAFLLWLVAFLPLTILSYHKIVPNLWVAFSIITLTLGTYTVCDNLTDDNSMSGRQAYMIFLGIIISGPFILAIMAAISNFFKNERMCRSYLFWAIICALGLVGFNDFLGSANIYRWFISYRRSSIDLFSLSYIVLHVSFFIFMVTVIVQKKFKSYISILAIIFYLMFLSVVFIAPLSYNILKPASVATFTILFFIVAGMFALKSGYTRVFNILLVLTGLRFLIVYFQAIGDLAYTGVGLIVSGGVILLSVWLWHKHHENIQKRVERLLHEE